MAILFAVVARGTTILAKHAWCGGNFLEVTEQILAKIPFENNKLMYSHGNYFALQTEPFIAAVALKRRFVSLVF
uniref:Uncharacterized protein n=1 Tax=Balaenoptera musculus TaxID=9771 RepID=A0A8C0DHE0_BALMU